MNDDQPSPDLHLTKFGIGQSVPRMEDPVLLRGAGQYTDDLKLPGQAFAVMVRSAVAHGIIRKLDITAAQDMPGVLGVYTGADLEARGYGRIGPMIQVPNRDGTPMRAPLRAPLPTTRVRFVGEAVAAVVAETEAEARDAAEQVVVEIDPLPAVNSIEAARVPGAPLVHDDVPANVSVDYHWGDSAAVEAAFAGAAHVTRLTLVSNRIIINPLEPRSAIGEFEASTGRWILRTGTQGVFASKSVLARDILKVPPEQVRVLTGNVGGSFGMRVTVFPEHVAVLHAARELGRPVRWRDDRSESFLADHHGRDHLMEAELALDAEGRFLAVRLTGYGNCGAYPVVALPYTVNAVKNVVGAYRTPLLEVASKGVYTNTAPVGAYRGAGRPEGNYFMERLVEAAAAEIGIDRIELRRRNQIPPDALPHKAPSDMTYDSGDFTALMDEALELADFEGFPARREESRAAGRLRGIGIGSYLEVTAPPGKEMGGIRFEPDGTVTMITGTLDYGQGHGSPFAQVMVDRLGIPFERLRLLQGDSDELLLGGGTGGSRSITASGAALLRAADEVIDRARRVAAHYLEAAEADLEFGSGRFTIVGTDRSVGLLDIAARLRAETVVPGGLPSSIDAALAVDTPPSSFPNGCHVAEVEIDPETGVTEVVRYTMVNDFGTLVNPMLVEGQAHGGIVQGIGQALMERTVYSEDGQLLSGSFMDYALPRADNAPMFRFGNHPTRAKTNPLGVKGCGEAGCAGALPAVMTAVVDALAPLGIRHINMPATPLAVWEAIQQARSGGSQAA